MLEVYDVTKKFKNGKGIFNVSFSVKKGEVFGFLGPNGSGKSTTIRHIMGFMKPDNGYIKVNDLDTWKSQGKVQKYIGYLPGEIAFLEGMTGKGFLDFIARMQGLDDLSKQKQLIERLRLDVNTPIRKMSKGMKQKVGIVAALMHNPEVIILDEPTSGLDPLMQRLFIELMLEEKAKGKTILLSSHSMEEVEKTCDRAAIIKNGKIVTIKDIHELQSMQRKLFEVTFQNSADADAFTKSKLDIVFHQKNVVRVAIQGNFDEFLAETSKYPVRNIDVFTQNLEEIFINYYEGER
ncbi:ABC transporter ATP-binding protein [Rummeliibacillus suwonensis]|uniref:ABC transporter ATP-binding protein n=1 Tax=Rummeliibacillus suwonensis TaxID=1306154 RepID=UPI001AAF938A|nr:ABC transporter ATP-binding protein [Rummeliibacillus suwonensis]MBO2536284.1 ABC transporter ATP-binding protein [Rummeliibacillus suwonensis]